MSSHFERPENTTAERFRATLIEKASGEIKKVVQQRIEGYYQQHVDRQKLDSAATRIFELVLQGEPEEAIENKLAILAAESFEK